MMESESSILTHQKTTQAKKPGDFQSLSLGNLPNIGVQSSKGYSGMGYVICEGKKNRKKKRFSKVVQSEAELTPIESQVS